jgi:hypothetical protein
MIPDYFTVMRQQPPSRPDGPAERRGPGGEGRGVTVLVPTYSPLNGDRSARLRRCVQSVLAAARVAGGLPVAFVIVDNGLTPTARADLSALLKAVDRPSLVVETAVPSARLPGRYTAAAARNAGLAALAALPEDAPERQRHLLFLDDDAAPAATALAALRATLDAQPAAVAACPAVVPVADPGAWLETAPRGGAGPRRLPGPIREGRYDLLSVTSHGSLVAGRTVGLLVRQKAVLDSVRRRGPLFFEGTPFGSSEDMLAMAMLAGLGELWSVPSARVADETRDTPAATRTQQFAWGYDHAWLVRALAERDGLEPGVHVLDWQPDGWRQHLLRPAARTGFLVNPGELFAGYRILSAAHADPAMAEGLFGRHAAEVRAGLPILADALRLWRRARPGDGRRRGDLPPLGRRGWSGLRDGLDALVGHLAGNAAGSAANDETGGFFLFGARQPARADGPRRVTHDAQALTTDRGAP